MPNPIDTKQGYALKTERGERPFIYSAEYQDWHNAVIRKDDRATAEADRAWRRRFRPISANASAAA